MAGNFPVWPGWETTRVIGRGGFGTVYEIRRDVLGKTEYAALKELSIPQSPADIDALRYEGFDDESIRTTLHESMQSVANEYHIMHELSGNSNIVSCDDLSYRPHDDGLGWDISIKMELLTPIVAIPQSEFDEKTIIKLGIDLTKALTLCKKHNIIHRDIKPQNIFRSPDGEYKLGDFGVAKIVEKTSRGTKIGTFKYMAPEVYNDEAYGTAADIYSLGLVLYWLLNERRMPFQPLPPEPLSTATEDYARKLRLHGGTIPPPLNGSEALKAIVLKACKYNPKERYGAPAEMTAALAKITDNTESGHTASNDMPEEPNYFDLSNNHNKPNSVIAHNKYESENGGAPSVKKGFFQNFKFIIAVAVIAVAAVVALVIVKPMLSTEKPVADTEVSEETAGKSSENEAGEISPETEKAAEEIPVGEDNINPDELTCEVSPGSPFGRKLSIAGAESSSELYSAGGVKYSAELAVDGNIETCWQYSENDRAAYITVFLNDVEEISAVSFNMGFQSMNYYIHNRRPKTVKIEFSNGEKINAELEDTESAQTVSLSRSVSADSFRVSVLDVYEGDMYTDTCISEIAVYGNNSGSN